MLCQKDRELRAGILQHIGRQRDAYCAAERAAQMSRSPMRILCYRDTSHGQGSDAETVKVKHGSYDGAEKYGLGLVAAYLCSHLSPELPCDTVTADTFCGYSS